MFAPNNGIVYPIIKKYSSINPLYDWEDLQQEAYISKMYTDKHHDETKGQYNTLLGIAVNHQLWKAVNHKNNTTSSLNVKIDDTNDEIVDLIEDNTIDLNEKLFQYDLKTLLDNHCSDVQNIALGIAENLPFSLQSKVDKTALKEAAYLHDIGKVLIPPEVLNKNGKLNDYETEVMHKHSELGYEILKNTNISKKTLDLIRNHHQNAKRSGYPFVNKDFRADLDLQILTMADKYSALTEKRVYKEAMTPKQALTIICSDVKEGKLHPFVFKALVSYANSLKAENVQLV